MDFVLYTKDFLFRWAVEVTLLALFSFGADLFAEDVALENMREVEFAMDSVNQPQTVYGVSVLLECKECDSQSFSEIEISRISTDGERKHVFEYRAYFHGSRIKNFYNFSNFEPIINFYGANDKSLQLEPNDHYIAKITTSTPVTYFLNSALNKQDDISKEWWKKHYPKAYGSPYVKWFAQSYQGNFYGLPLNTIEKPYREILSFIVANGFQFLFFVMIFLIAFRKDILKKDCKSAFLISYLICTLFFILYFVTVCTDHPGGDSQEFQIAQLAFRDLHQPGDPILAMSAAAFGKYFSFGNFMYKGHLLAAILSSLALGLTGAALYLFSSSIYASVIPAAILATGTAYWNYAVIAQNYSMSSFFQSLMLFFTFNALRRPNNTNFILAFVGSVLMLTVHPTNAYWVFFCAFTILPVLRLTENRIRSFLIATFVTAVLVVSVYIPYILLLPSPQNFRPVLVFLGDAGQLMSRSDPYHYLAVSRDGLQSFIRYILGNSETQSWTGGIASMAGGRGIFTIVMDDWKVPFKVLSIGFGILPTTLGILGLLKMLQARGFRLVGAGLLLTFLINFVINICEVAYFHVGYLDIYVVHLFPMYFVLCISISALLFNQRKMNFA